MPSYRFSLTIKLTSPKKDPPTSNIAQNQPPAAAPSTPNPSINLPKALNIQNDAHIWQIVDPEMARDNPVEDKHRRLVRSHRSGPLDRELKPNAHDRDALTVSLQVLAEPIIQLCPFTEYLELSSYSSVERRRQGPYLALPVLPHAGEERTDEVPQICCVEGSERSQTSG